MMSDIYDAQGRLLDEPEEPVAPRPMYGGMRVTSEEAHRLFPSMEKLATDLILMESNRDGLEEVLAKTEADLATLQAAAREAIRAVDMMFDTDVSPDEASARWSQAKDTLGALVGWE